MPPHGVSAPAPTPPRAGPTPSRDSFLDVVRAVSISRVVVVHLLAPLAIGHWYAWLFPGMPIVFFVAGALAFASLDPWRAGGVDARAFRLNRLTRLLVPYWVFALVAVTVAAAAAVLWPSAETALRVHALPTVVVPAVIPTWSAVVRDHTGHLWFASNIVVLVLVAPWLARAARRWRWWPLTLSGGWFLAVVAADHLDAGLFREARSLSVYAVMFCAGFLYTDRTFRPARWWGPALFAVSLVAALVMWAVVGGIPSTQPLVGLPVAVCWLLAALGVRQSLRRAGERHHRVVGWVSARTLTLYLWGWPTSRLGIRVADATAPRHSALWTAVFVAAALGLLAVATAVFFPVERRAADLARSFRPAGSGRAGRVAAA